MIIIKCTYICVYIKNNNVADLANITQHNNKLSYKNEASLLAKHINLKSGSFLTFYIICGTNRNLKRMKFTEIKYWSTNINII